MDVMIAATKEQLSTSKISAGNRTLSFICARTSILTSSRAQTETVVMQPAELLALRAQWRRISNDARAEFKLLFERGHEHSGSFSSTPVHVSKVTAEV
jgi:hypothetical protein